MIRFPKSQVAEGTDLEELALLADADEVSSTGDDDGVVEVRGARWAGQYKGDWTMRDTLSSPSSTEPNFADDLRCVQAEGGVQIF